MHIHSIYIYMASNILHYLITSIKVGLCVCVCVHSYVCMFPHMFTWNPEVNVGPIIHCFLPYF